MGSLFSAQLHINDLQEVDIAKQLNYIEKLSAWKKKSQLAITLTTGGVLGYSLYYFLIMKPTISPELVKKLEVASEESKSGLSAFVGSLKSGAKSAITTIPSAFLQILFNPVINYASNKIFGEINLNWFFNRTKVKSNLEDIKMVVRDLDKFAQDPYLKDVFENYRTSLNVAVDLYVKNMALMIALILFNKDLYPDFQGDISKIVFNIKELSNKLVDLINESLEKNNFDGVGKNVDALLDLVEKNISAYGCLENTL